MLNRRQLALCVPSGTNGREERQCANHLEPAPPLLPYTPLVHGAARVSAGSGATDKD